MNQWANVAASQAQGTAEVIQAESQLWSILSFYRKFINQKLPHGPVSYNFCSLVLTFHFTIKQDFLFRFYVGGETAEVYWKSNGYHRGGYSYRLCQVHDGQYWKVTEECFQQGYLNFAGKKYSLFEVV